MGRFFGMMGFIATWVVFFSVSVAAADRADPYNAYIWNKANHGDWYEWWYYKVVPPDSPQDAFFFVYGVVNPWDTARTRPASRSYVTFGSFAENLMVERTLGPADFSASRDATDVRVGDAGAATDRALSGRIDGVEWNLTLEHDWKFNAMGWAMFRDWLFNIYWYPAQASAFMTGEITVNGRRIQLDHAPAYQDRNWGKSFPVWWTWIVSNHFKNSPGSVLAVGGGRPETVGSDRLEGVTIGLRHGGREYAFRPVDGDIVRVNVRFGHWEVTARNLFGDEIQISATAPRDKFMDLRFITPTGAVFHDFEALRGQVSVKVLKRGKVIAELESDEAGIEYGSADADSFQRLYDADVMLQ